MKKAIILDDKDISLIRGLLNQHKEIAFRRKRTHEFGNIDGCSDKLISEYKRLISRFDRLLSLFKVEF